MSGKQIGNEYWKLRESNEGGAPLRVFSEEEIRTVCALAIYLTKAQMAGHFGISENTFRAIEERQPEVGIEYERGRAKKLVVAAKSLMEQIEEGSTQATIFLLKTQGGWKETVHNITQNVEMTHEEWLESLE